MNKAALSVLIRARRMARFARESRQAELIGGVEIQKASMEAKLAGLGSGRWWENLLRCGREEMFATCTRCGRFTKFFYACNQKFCPRCARKLAGRRAAILEKWSEKLKQPKHVVLTMRNFEILTGRSIREFRKALKRLRNEDCWREVTGGCATIELTHEGRGWHLHAHLLVEAAWVDAKALAISWGTLIGQNFGIVKVKDARDRDYISEVSKYVVKGSELARWPGELILEMILAVRGKRLFFPFGSLWGKQGAIKAQLALARPPGKMCECGCEKFVYETETDSILDECRQFDRRRGRR
jgi:hypothetical protein